MAKGNYRGYLDTSQILDKSDESKLNFNIGMFHTKTLISHTKKPHKGLLGEHFLGEYGY
jgi:hypothetical protein